MEKNFSLEGLAPKERNEAIVERWLEIQTKGASVGTLPRRYGQMTPAQKAEALYDFLQTLKLSALDEAEKESGDVLRSYAKALSQDVDTMTVFKSRFADARIESGELKKSPLFKESKTLEKDIDSLTKSHHDLERKLFIGEIKGSASRKVSREELSDIAGNLVEKTAKQKALIRLEGITDPTKEITDVAANQEYETLKRYHQEAKEGFAWLPSRHEIHRKIMGALSNGRFPLLVGEPGTGKSEQANAVAKELTGEDCVKAPCTQSSGEHDLMASKEVEGGTSFLKYGYVSKAFTGYDTSIDTAPKHKHGRIVRLDEFLKINFDKTFGLIKDIAQKKPGDMMHENIPHPVLEGSTIIATTNPAGTRHELNKMLPALEREFAEIKVDYLPMESSNPELYEFMLASLMDDNGRIPVSKSELAPAYVKKEAAGKKTSDGKEIAFTEEILPEKDSPSHGALYRLAFAMKSIQDSYVAGNPDERKQYEDTLLKFSTDGKISDTGEVLTLGSSTLTLKEIGSWMKGFHSRLEKANKEMHVETLALWFAYKAKIFVSQCPEDDRAKLTAIFDHFGILNPKPVPETDVPMTNLDIGYLSPRVPRPVLLKEVKGGEETKSKAAQRENIIPQEKVLNGTERVLETGGTILVYPNGYEFSISKSAQKYEISSDQKFHYDGKEWTLGASKDGDAVLWNGRLARVIPAEDFLKMLEKQKFVSVEEAEKMLGKEQFSGSEDILKAYGFKPEKLPPIPFGKEEIEWHKKQGHMLVYDISKTLEGLPLSVAEIGKRAGSNVINQDEYRLYKTQFDDMGNIKSDAWFSSDPLVLSETPSGEWKFVSPEVLKGSESKNYKQQTDFLIKYWTDNFFTIKKALSKDKIQIPDEYAKAFAQWEKDKDTLSTAAEFAAHPVSKILRECFASTVSRYVILQKAKNKKILADKYSWSCSPSSDGSLVYFGLADSDGADVSWGVPGLSYGRLGVVLSRMKTLEFEK